MSGPLTGYRVIDFTQLLPGPLTSRYLADLGAEVIKLEDVAGSDLIRIVPPYDNGVSSSHIAINRNKKSIALNLKSANGQEILHRLVETCDILVESYRPGTATRLGADYETLRKVNSRLVYCSISGYGQTGPYKLRPGHDINYESYCGFLGLTGESVDKPPSLPAVPVADIAGGSLNAVIAILAAIIAREKTGKGQYIDLSMLDGLLSLMVTLYPAYFADRNLPERGKTALTGYYPFYGIYRTKDNQYVSLGAIEVKFWTAFCESINHPELIDKQFGDDNERLTMRKFLEEVFLSKTKDEWMEILEDAGVCVAPINTLDDSLKNPQILARGMIINTSHPEGGNVVQINFPAKFSETAVNVGRYPAPKHGEHTKEILIGLGFSPKEIDRLVGENIVKIYSE